MPGADHRDARAVRSVVLHRHSSRGGNAPGSRAGYPARPPRRGNAPRGTSRNARGSPATSAGHARPRRTMASRGRDGPGRPRHARSRGRIPDQRREKSRGSASMPPSPTRQGQQSSATYPPMLMQREQMMHLRHVCWQARMRGVRLYPALHRHRLAERASRRVGQPAFLTLSRALIRSLPRPVGPWRLFAPCRYTRYRRRREKPHESLGHDNTLRHPPQQCEKCGLRRRPTMTASRWHP